MSTISIAAPMRPTGDYDVVVEPGALDALPRLLSAMAPAERYAIIADAVVADLLGASLRERLEAGGLVVELVRFPAGEQNKTRESWGSVTDALIGRGLGRDSCILALGGGVTGDLAGFVAATFMRGIPFVQLPTTLLAMVDAAIGGKTGVDTPVGKNLVGAFHQPAGVIVDPRVLGTLPDDYYRSGLAETVKHGAVADPEYLEWIERNARSLLAKEEGELTALIERSLEIKAGIVGEDPRELGGRQALNFGHTLGHALETWSGYRIPHGHAVGIGMVAAAEVGEEAGVTEEGAAGVLRRVLSALLLPLRPSGVVPVARVLDLTRRDKKARGQRTRYTLLRRIGEVARPPDGAWTFPLEEDAITPVLERIWE